MYCGVFLILRISFFSPNGVPPLCCCLNKFGHFFGFKLRFPQKNLNSTPQVNPVLKLYRCLYTSSFYFYIYVQNIHEQHMRHIETKNIPIENNWHQIPCKIPLTTKIKTANSFMLKPL